MLRAWQRWPTFSEQGAPKVDRCSKHAAHSPSARPAVGQVDVPVELPGRGRGPSVQGNATRRSQRRERKGKQKGRAVWKVLPDKQLEVAVIPRFKNRAIGGFHQII